MVYKSFEKYQTINNKSFLYNREDYALRFSNINNLYYYYVQRNLKSGHKLRCLNQLSNTLRLLKYYSLYFSNKYNSLFRFQDGFHTNFLLAQQYKTNFPIFSLRLQNEYKGKHKTKRKFMYPIFLEKEKSQLFELAL